MESRVQYDKCGFCGMDPPDHPGRNCPMKTNVKYNKCFFCGMDPPDHPGRDCPMKPDSNPDRPASRNPPRRRRIDAESACCIVEHGTLSATVPPVYDSDAKPSEGHPMPSDDIVEAQLLQRQLRLRRCAAAPAAASPLASLHVSVAVQLPHQSLMVCDDNDDEVGDDSDGNGKNDAQEAEAIPKCGVCMPEVQQWPCRGGCGRVACGVDIPISQELRAAIGTVKDWCCGSCPMNKQYLKGWLGRHAESEHGPRCGRCACKY